MPLPAFLSRAVETWSAFYGDHRMVSVTVRAFHLGSLIVGGGTALVADRSLLRGLRRGPSERTEHLAALEGAHRVVVPALAVTVLTGILMTAADAETFFGSWLYWTKMGLFTLLLVNGSALVLAERGARTDRAGSWTWLGIVSAVSLALWLVLVFFGVWLSAAA